jgi:hypothetical protein
VLKNAIVVHEVNHGFFRFKIIAWGYGVTGSLDASIYIAALLGGFSFAGIFAIN